ncbi:hypothetical protein HRI_000827600 [Hibiscus trionum]|uniref:Uncharacterized protein n=1 Tax=Hibiscus trionum TaxID=183268 RepID=A0A9W7LP07_HIBTR|nr:hypothetical protein HRI_000827600 [Hibiscus trionum]
MVEYIDHSLGQTQLALTEAPNEALPLSTCFYRVGIFMGAIIWHMELMPNFGAAWLTKDKFKITSVSTKLIEGQKTGTSGLRKKLKFLWKRTTFQIGSNRCLIHYHLRITRIEFWKYWKALRYLDVCWDLEDIDQEKSSSLRKTKSQIFTNSSAYMALNDIDGAVESFKKALDLEPNDGGIKKELAAARKKIADRRDQEKKTYSRMFL